MGDQKSLLIHVHEIPYVVMVMTYVHRRSRAFENNLGSEMFHEIGFIFVHGRSWVFMGVER